MFGRVHSEAIWVGILPKIFNNGIYFFWYKIIQLAFLSSVVVNLYLKEFVYFNKIVKYSGIKLCILSSLFLNVLGSILMASFSFMLVTCVFSLFFLDNVAKSLSVSLSFFRSKLLLCWFLYSKLVFYFIDTYSYLYSCTFFGFDLLFFYLFEMEA